MDPMGSSKLKNNRMLPYIKELKVIIQASYYHNHRQVPAKKNLVEVSIIFSVHYSQYVKYPDFKNHVMIPFLLSAPFV